MQLLASARAAEVDGVGGLVPSIDLAVEMGEEEAQTAAVILAWTVVAVERDAERLRDDAARLTRERDEREDSRDVVRLEARVELLEGELRRLRDLVDVIDVPIIDEVLHA
jgi:hypothetical protein